MAVGHHTDYVHGFRLGDLEALDREPPERFIESRHDFRDGAAHMQYRCPVTGRRVQMPGDPNAQHRGLVHFAHRWRDAILHLQQAGLRTPEEMAAPLEIIFQRIAHEAVGEAHREMHVGFDPVSAPRTATEVAERQRFAEEQIREMQRTMAMPYMAIDAAAFMDVDFLSPGRIWRVDVDPEAEKRRKKAEKTARELLVKCLTPAQRADFEKNQAFDVEVTAGGSFRARHTRADPLGQRGLEWGAGRYRIAKGSAFNVTHVESGTRYCVVAAESVPVYDQMLAQKLLLENEPAKFFETANVSAPGLHDGRRVDFINGVDQRTLTIRRPNLFRRLIRT